MIAGKKGHGKNTVANFIQDYCEENGIETNEYAFADPFKELMCATFGIDIDTLNKLKNDRTPITSMDNSLAIDMRLILQNFGEGAKGVFGRNVWAEQAYRNLHSEKLNIITDLRLKLEQDYFISSPRKPIIIKVHRPSKEHKIDNHVSESEIDLINEDYFISNDSTEEDLKAEVYGIMHELYD